jgi:hypothetical protein
MSIRALIVGVAALLLATGAAHAERRLGPFYKPPAGSPSPWTEADGEDIIFFAVQGITCEGVNYSVWQPYNVKLQKQLDFLRLMRLVGDIAGDADRGAALEDDPLGLLRGEIAVYVG